MVAEIAVFFNLVDNNLKLYYATIPIKTLGIKAIIGFQNKKEVNPGAVKF